MRTTADKRPAKFWQVVGPGSWSNLHPVGEDRDTSSKLQLSHLYAYTCFPAMLRVVLSLRIVLSSNVGADMHSLQV
jgi:hypothetical protein